MYKRTNHFDTRITVDENMLLIRKIGSFGTVLDRNYADNFYKTGI